ncbi:MAG: GTP-binding protein, partial [Clostridia bacterium]|nr:GTP-binding protein [Clostridia bacterium]
MTKIDIFSGFLGAGKTTLIKKLIEEVYQGEKLVLIENEFGEIGIDGGFLQDAGVAITEMNSGCICCSLVGDFSRALGQVVEEYHPDRILIEPSGVGKLSDVLGAVQRADIEGAEISALVTVVDAKKCKMYTKNFGEFFCDQIKVARTVIFSHTDTASPAKVEEALALVRAENPTALIVTTPIAELSADQLRDAISGAATTQDLMRETEAALIAQREAEHHHHEHDEHCTCGCHDHEHHHHDHDHHEH